MDIDSHGQSEQSGSRRLPNESQRDFLIRTGKITPFSKLGGRPLARSGSTLQDVLLDAEEGRPEDQISGDEVQVQDPRSHRNLIRPGFVDDGESDSTSAVAETPRRSTKRKRSMGEPVAAARSPTGSHTRTSTRSPSPSTGGENSTFEHSSDSREGTSITQYEEEIWMSDESEDFTPTTLPLPRRKPRGSGKSRAESRKEDLRGIDDGNERIYQERLSDWASRRNDARRKSLGTMPSRS